MACGSHRTDSTVQSSLGPYSLATFVLQRGVKPLALRAITDITAFCRPDVLHETDAVTHTLPYDVRI